MLSPPMLKDIENEIGKCLWARAYELLAGQSYPGLIGPGPGPKLSF